MDIFKYSVTLTSRNSGMHSCINDSSGLSSAGAV